MTMSVGWVKSGCASKYGQIIVPALVASGYEEFEVIAAELLLGTT